MRKRESAVVKVCFRLWGDRRALPGMTSEAHWSACCQEISCLDVLIMKRCVWP
jgi:hypothetical protein